MSQRNLKRQHIRAIKKALKNRDLRRYSSYIDQYYKIYGYDALLSLMDMLARDMPLSFEIINRDIDSVISEFGYGPSDWGAMTDENYKGLLVA